MRCFIVDVFAETRFAGNQLAVVRDCAGLDTEGMQNIAREMNFSETTFVIDERDDAARVRIFTPTRELPFAGHPTVGTAWVLGRHRAEFTLELDAGRVPVHFDADGLAWMTPPEAELGSTPARDDVSDLVGLGPDDLDASFPPRNAVVGPSFVLVGVKGLAALQNVVVDAARLKAVPGEALRSLFVFTGDAYDADADFAARMFFDANGIREDAATGSANTAFAYYLRDLGRSGRFVVQQGFEMQRPSHLYLDITDDAIRVGGRVQQVVEGELWFDTV